jgi:hypothetical protein
MTGPSAILFLLSLGAWRWIRSGDGFDLRTKYRADTSGFRFPPIFSGEGNRGDAAVSGGSIERQADVIFGEGLRGSARAGDVVQFGELAALIEGIVVFEAVQHGSHPPRKALHFPDAA